MPVTQALLDSYLNKHIRDICYNRFDDNARNHCAHFVSHVLQIKYKKTCHVMVARSHVLAPGGSILVDDLFEITPNVHEMQSCPLTGLGLIYISAPGNFVPNGHQGYKIRQVKKRHVGIFLNGNVWHYSNLDHKVIKQYIPEFIRHFKRNTDALWIGDLPNQSRPAECGTCA